MPKRLISRFFSLSMRTQLFLIALIVALPAAGIILHSGIAVRRAAIAQAVEQTREMCDQLATQQRHAAESAELLLATLAQLPEIRNHHTEPTRRILADILKLNPLFLNISVIDPGGTVWASAVTSTQGSVADLHYFKNAMATGRLSSGEYIVSGMAEKPTIHLCYPFRRADGAMAGALSASFRLDRLGPAVAENAPERYSYVIVDRNGVILDSRWAEPGLKDNPESFRQMQYGSENETFVGIGTDGQKRFRTFRRLYLKGGSAPYMYVRTSIPVSAVVGQANTLLIRNLAIFLSSLLCAYWVAWLIAKRSILDPVSVLRGASRRLAGGDLKVRVSDSVESRELGELGRSFDEMAQQLETRERERDLAGQALRKSEGRFRSLFDNSLFGIVALDAGKTFVQVNQAFCSLVGYREDELVGVRGFVDIVHPDELGQSLEAYRRMVRREIKHYTQPKRYLAKTGEVLHVICMVQGLYDEEGRFEGNIACILDITERVAHEEQTRLFFERQVVGMAITSPEKGWLRTNARLREMLGYSDDELARLSWADLTHPEDLDKDVHLFNQILSGAIDDYSLEKRFIRKDGRELHCELSVGCVRRHDGRVKYFLALISDISERKKAEEELMRLQASLEQRVLERTAQLEAAIREQESFSYSVSHDLRSPLRHINSYLGIIEEDFGESFCHEALYYMERARAASVRMGKLIDDLLELSRVSRSKLVKEPVDLSDLALAIVTTLQETDPERPSQFVITPNLKAMGDKALMELVLANLLGNAWKYTSKKESALLMFGSREVEGKTAFFVSDNGAGFDMAYSGKLFGAFQRLHGEEYDGTGIGLATVRRIMERHGGRVWAEGIEGAGATFYFSLP